MVGSNSWTEALLAGRFAAPTSAGILFSMLAAAGLSGTWVFRKARVLAIFDDLDTVLLMIPLDRFRQEMSAPRLVDYEMRRHEASGRPRAGSR